MSNLTDAADQPRVHSRIRRFQICRYCTHIPLSSRSSKNTKCPCTNRDDTSLDNTVRHPLCLAERELPGVLQGTGYQCLTNITGDVHDVCGIRESGVGLPVRRLKRVDIPVFAPICPRHRSCT